jgi:hypothetical protein
MHALEYLYSHSFSKMKTEAEIGTSTICMFRPQLFLFPFQIHNYPELDKRNQLHLHIRNNV